MVWYGTAVDFVGLVRAVNLAVAALLARNALGVVADEVGVGTGRGRCVHH